MKSCSGSPKTVPLIIVGGKGCGMDMFATEFAFRLAETARETGCEAIVPYQAPTFGLYDSLNRDRFLEEFRRRS